MTNKVKNLKNNKLLFFNDLILKIIFKEVR